MTYTEINGARFHCRLDGAADAPVVVFSNSLGTNLAMWDAQIPGARSKSFASCATIREGTASRTSLPGRTRSKV